MADVDSIQHEGLGERTQSQSSMQIIADFIFCRRFRKNNDDSTTELRQIKEVKNDSAATTQPRKLFEDKNEDETDPNVDPETGSVKLVDINLEDETA